MRDKLKEEFQLVHSGISTIQESANGFTETILININDVFGMVQDNARQIKTLSEELLKLTARPAVAPVETSFRPPTVVNAGTQTLPDPTTIIGNAINFADRSSMQPTDVSNFLDGKTLF